jgi:hypothetical protein
MGPRGLEGHTRDRGGSPSWPLCGRWQRQGLRRLQPSADWTLDGRHFAPPRIVGTPSSLVLPDTSSCAAKAS